MPDTKEVFLVFYGVFWAAVINSIDKYHPFDTHLFSSKDKRYYAIPRFIVAFVIINVASILWFLILLYCLPEKSDAFSIIAAACASLSIFGFNRILHSIIATESCHSKFYSDCEWEKIKKGHNGKKGSDLFIDEIMDVPLFSSFFLLVQPLIDSIRGKNFWFNLQN